MVGALLAAGVVARLLVRIRGRGHAALLRSLVALAAALVGSLWLARGAAAWAALLAPGRSGSVDLPGVLAGWTGAALLFAAMRLAARDADCLPVSVAAGFVATVGGACLLWAVCAPWAAVVPGMLATGGTEAVIGAAWAGHPVAVYVLAATALAVLGGVLLAEGATAVRVRADVVAVARRPLGPAVHRHAAPVAVRAR